MSMKWLGAGLVIAGCGSFGAALVRAYRREEAMLRMLLRALKWMECELDYHLTPLPELCRLTAQKTSGPVQSVFQSMAQALEQQIAPDAAGCMKTILEKSWDIPFRIRQILHLLGSSMGSFDLTGQMESLNGAQAACTEALDIIRSGREQRLRSYQTLSLCAGAALVILLI